MATDDPKSNGSPKDDPFNDDKKETTNGPLFYAYARRTDSSWASRYLITFASAAIANEWWDLVQDEYPDAGVRTSAQLFSFNGDNFLYKPANSKKFDHLKTKWFYTQFGDATGTGGRAQDIIPFQDGEGKIIGGGCAGDRAVEGSSKGDSNDALEKSLQRIQEIMESNATQIKDLVVAQSKSQERMTYMEKMLEESTTQIEALTEGQSAHQSYFQQTAEENKEHLRSLAEGQSEQAGQFRQFLASNAQVSSDVAKELKRQRQQAQKQAEAAEKGNVDACVHNVHPPPRKIDMPIVGYDYGKITTSRKIKVDKS